MQSRRPPAPRSAPRGPAASRVPAFAATPLGGSPAQHGLANGLRGGHRCFGGGREPDS